MLSEAKLSWMDESLLEMQIFNDEREGKGEREDHHI
jgi:hypothetical protein